MTDKKDEVEFILFSLVVLIQPMIEMLDINPSETILINSEGEKVSLETIMRQAETILGFETKVNENNMIH